MFQLAKILEDGDEGLEANPKRAFRLYKGCLEKEATPACVIRVINLLKKGVPGTEEDVTRTVALLEKAIDEFSDTETMQYLDRLLNTLVEEVTRDIGFVFELYEREFQESSTPVEISCSTVAGSSDMKLKNQAKSSNGVV